MVLYIHVAMNKPARCSRQVVTFSNTDYDEKRAYLGPVDRPGGTKFKWDGPEYFELCRVFLISPD